MRELVEIDPSTPIDGSSEVVIAAAETGAAMHHCHVNSTSKRHIDRVLAMLTDARAAGSRVTVEAYPYGMGSTSVGAFFLAPDRLPAAGLTPSSIVMLGTGERIADARRLDELRELDPGATCFVEFLDERDQADRERLHQALAFPDSIVASDAMPVEWPDGRPTPASGRCRPARPPIRAPRGPSPAACGSWCANTRTGTGSKPSGAAPTCRPACSTTSRRRCGSKGHLAPGSDADLVVLDPAAITDNASVADPVRPSSGVRHLLVGGTFVIRDGRLDTDAYPGRAVRGEPR